MGNYHARFLEGWGRATVPGCSPSNRRISLLETSNTNVSAITALSLAIISSLIGGLLIAYFTNIIFKPDVVYTLSGSDIKLPNSYEKELSKARAAVWLKNMTTVLGTVSKKQLTVEPGVKDNKVGIKKHSLEVLGPNLIGNNKNTITVSGDKLDEMIETLEKPETLHALLSPSTNFPTAFATVDIFNTGNREATDLEINVVPNGILIESHATSTEPSAEKWEEIIDPQTALPVGIHLPSIKRLPPGGKIQVKVYWHKLGTIGASEVADDLIVSVKGSYSGGMMRYTEAQPSSERNWPVLVALAILISISSAVLGFLYKRGR